ncbi:F-box domain-containing protein [Mycena sanguinolenta]|uniref:F-box domain-containing protein n=1 Tax=Mycena sanguinolenta TaxID=230812 RepID=A0A8H6YFZ5_9AGAR|nr:F-box domain-containing protein [Mycena sanguinolenta]
MPIASASFSVRDIVLEQTERTRYSSQADLKRLIRESQSKITSLDALINPLIQLRERERACVAALEYLSSSIYTLPVELLAEIFDLAIDDKTHIKDIYRITQVCSDWRKVAHGTPRLWTRLLPLNLRHKKDDEAQVYLDGLKAWLAHSAPFTVPVSIDMMKGEFISHRMVDEVLNTASRWCSLAISTNAPLSLVRQLAGCRLDSIENLDLGLSRDGESPFYLGFRTLASFTHRTLPRLRKLALDIYTLSLPIRLPWAQLTDLTLFCDSPHLALDILAQCANLTRGFVSTSGWDSWDWTPTTNRNIFALSHLQSLTLPFISSEGDVTPFFDYLSAPALEELCLDFEDMIVEDHECWPNSSRFTAFLLRSPHITRLELTDLRHSTLTSDDILAFLQHTVYLTHLKVTEPSSDCFDDVLISALTYHDGKIPLVPCLQYFALESTYTMNFTEDILAEMITSRWWIDAESTTPPCRCTLDKCGTWRRS